MVMARIYQRSFGRSGVSILLGLLAATRGCGLAICLRLHAICYGSGYEKAEVVILMINRQNSLSASSKSRLGKRGPQRREDEGSSPPMLDQLHRKSMSVGWK